MGEVEPGEWDEAEQSDGACSEKGELIEASGGEGWVCVRDESGERAAGKAAERADADAEGEDEAEGEGACRFRCTGGDGGWETDGPEGECGSGEKCQDESGRERKKKCARGKQERRGEDAESESAVEAEASNDVRCGKGSEECAGGHGGGDEPDGAFVVSGGDEEEAVEEEVDGEAEVEEEAGCEKEKELTCGLME